MNLFSQSPLAQSIHAKLNEAIVAGDLLKSCPALSAKKHTNSDVVKLLNKNPDWVTLAVVKKNKPVGLISRRSFMDNMGNTIYSVKKAVAYLWINRRWSSIKPSPSKC